MDSDLFAPSVSTAGPAGPTSARTVEPESAQRCQAFVEALRDTPSMPGVFNPWRDIDPLHDASEQAAAHRREHLQRYLEERCTQARLVLVGEAPGYQGCKFSGIAMTSERILLDRSSAVPARAVFEGRKHQTSATSLHPNGAIEPTATIAWSLLAGLGLDSREFVFWNAFPFHPHKPEEPLSNRAPTARELQAVAHLLPAFLALFGQARVVAVGRVAQRTLAGLGVQAECVRHPAMGGATAFRKQVSELLSIR